MTRTFQIRLGLVTIATLLVVMGTLQTGHSQPPTGIGGGNRGGPPTGPTMPGPGGIRGGITGIGGRPPGFPDFPGPPTGPTMPGPGGIRGGIGGRPPGFPEIPGPPTGPTMPGPGGIRGGITGIGGRAPGFPEIPGPPDFPQPPIGPIGPGFGRRPGIGGLPGGPVIYDWTCSRCNRQLGTGPTAPPIRICPGCGARLEGSEIVDGPRLPGNGGPPAFDNPGFGRPAFDNGVYVPPANPTPVESKRGGIIWVVAISLGILLLLGIGITAIVLVILKQQKPVKRSRPRRRLRYEDDDDY